MSFELVGAQALAERLARRRRRIWADQGVEHALLRVLLGLCLDLLAPRLARQGDADLDQVAHDGIDVAADVADLGELGGLHLEEGRAGELGQPARDLGLAAAGRADHQDVLRQHLFLEVAGELLAPPAVPERDGDGALGVLLADDVAVELGDDLAGGEAGHGCTCPIRLSQIIRSARPSGVSSSRCLRKPAFS